MEFPILHMDEEVGRCCVKDLGLYWDLECSCRILSDRVERVYAGRNRLGVLEREGERLTLRRRISKASVPDFPPRLKVLTLSPPWQGKLLDCELPPAVLLKGKLWYPAGEKQKFPCMPLFCLFHLEYCEKNAFWTIPLSAGTGIAVDFLR